MGPGFPSDRKQFASDAVLPFGCGRPAALRPLIKRTVRLPAMPATHQVLPTYQDLEEIIISEHMIKRRVKKLGEEITAAYPEEEITVVAIIKDRKSVV